MYRYDEFDIHMVNERVAQFREQVKRRLNGTLSEDAFKPLRLMNGVYLQLHAYMLRVAIPYGTLSSRQLRQLARIARQYDKGYGHFTTRQNIQFNWVNLSDIPDILAKLAEVEMHAIQTSGNCIRNVTSDQFAGAAADEIEDPRPWCELIRQWSSFHPEFSFLPRKFKISVSASKQDRAAIKLHDIGLYLRKDKAGKISFAVYVGGGQGRTPHIAQCIHDCLPKAELIDFLEAIMRTYNRFGRRDNKYKARIKILVHEMGVEAFRAAVMEEYAAQSTSESVKSQILDEFDRIKTYFNPPAFDTLPEYCDSFEAARQKDPVFSHWVKTNTHKHKIPGYVSLTITLKNTGIPPGDASAEQMEWIADLSRDYGHNEIRVSHNQNLVLPHIRLRDIYQLYLALKVKDLAGAHLDRLNDIIACPGLDYCNLANARALPIAAAIQKEFMDQDLQDEIGKMNIKISGCINACGHHHVGHVGILGVDKKGEEFYQISLGGRADERAAIGKIAGKGLSADQIPSAIKRITESYLQLRKDEAETFIDTLERLGDQPFTEALYAADQS